MAAFAALYAVEQLANRFGVAFTALERFGRRSLFVYWIHVELVYGYATWPLRGRLPLWGVGLAYAAFTALMYGAVVAFDNWRLAKPQIDFTRKSSRGMMPAVRDSAGLGLLLYHRRIRLARRDGLVLGRPGYQGWLGLLSYSSCKVF